MSCMEWILALSKLNSNRPMYTPIYNRLSVRLDSKCGGGSFILFLIGCDPLIVDLIGWDLTCQQRGDSANNKVIFQSLRCVSWWFHLYLHFFVVPCCLFSLCYNLFSFSYFITLFVLCGYIVVCRQFFSFLIYYIYVIKKNLIIVLVLLFCLIREINLSILKSILILFSHFCN